MNDNMKNNKVTPSLLLAAVLALGAGGALAQAKEPLPLSGPAFENADQAYKAYQQGDYDRAIALSREAIRLRPDVPRLRKLLADAQRAKRGGRAPAARVARQQGPTKVLRPVAPAGKPHDPAFLAADAAYKAYDRKDYGAAVTQAQEATRLAPTNRAYWLLLVNSLIAADRLQEADQALNQGLQAAGDDASLRTQRESIRRAMAQAAGTAMYRALEAGNLPAATSSARAAVQLAPENPAYRLILIEVLLRSEQFAEAERLASESVALLPDSVVPLAMRGYARQRQGRWPEAKADFDRALQQRGLSAAQQRNLRLVAADSALAAREPQRAIELLQGLPDSDAAVAQRRAAAARLTVRVSAQVPPLTSSSFPPPGLDCGAAESALTCALLPGQAGRDPAFEVASQAYRALEAKDYPLAADKAAQAVAISPGNRDYQLLLLDAQLGAGRLADAQQAATAALALEPGDAALLAQRGSIRKRLGDEAGAAEDFNAALATGRLAPAAEVGALADLGRKSEARNRFAQYQADGQLRGTSDLDLAYLAARVGDDESARALFASADAAGKLPDSALQDSAYSSLRAGKDGEAVNYFKRTIDAADSLKLKLEPQMLFDTRRAVADITREGGIIASLMYRGGGTVVSGFGATRNEVGNRSAQVGVEAYWRPFGYQNGRYVELFARGFETLYSQAGGATGGDSLQTALGVRWKPLSTQNLVLSLSRVFSKGADDDWLAQAGYSLDLGTDLRVDVDNWWTTRVAAEAGHYFQAKQDYGLASVMVGKSYRLSGDGKTVAYPHAVVAAEYNSLLPSDKLSVAAGPGVSLRRWFREDKYAAPRSYIDFSLDYRFRLAGDERAKGLFFTSLVSY
ncbi:tetratricopeptide repeat protein [Caenimonas terrae]|uniref:Tetratricopeptide repeat protein n=1 Tax=Caenimonas terrae TaxID=696074 RepID=A0ABW0N5N0_9BURK